jgi:hypothetical protein
VTQEVDEWVREGERRQRRWWLIGTVASTVAALVIVAVAVLISSNAIPAGDRRAIDAVEAAGMREVVLGGSSAFACADSETSRQFSAINSSGKRVEGTVCCGLTGVGKGCTIRWGR